jgi:hypothetical protein
LPSLVTTVTGLPTLAAALTAHASCVGIPMGKPRWAARMTMTPSPASHCRPGSAQSFIEHPAVPPGTGRWPGVSGRS